MKIKRKKPVFDQGAIRDFLTRLPLVMDEAHRIGLMETGNALHEAIRKAGYEAAELIERMENRKR